MAVSLRTHLLSAFDVCVALSPGSAQCYDNRARAHAALGHIELARRDDEHARRLGPSVKVASGTRVFHRARTTP